MACFCASSASFDRYSADPQSFSTVLETEFTTLMHLSPTLVLAELKTSLPCSEELWNAPTAEAWDSLVQTSPPPTLQVGALFKMITADSAFPLPTSIRLNPFACHLLVNAIHLLVWSSAQLSFIPNVAELAATNVRRSLSRLGRGENEFAPSFGTTEGEERFSAAGVSYHLAHIATHLRLEELDVVAGRWSSSDAASASAKVSPELIGQFLDMLLNLRSAPDRQLDGLERRTSSDRSSSCRATRSSCSPPSDLW
jgi:hypothetical protein